MKTTIIGIAGGTASGKTTLAKKVYDASQNYGSVIMIRLDDYYKKIEGKTYEERTLNYNGFVSAAQFLKDQKTLHSCFKSSRAFEE